jgi:peptide/nickel transport system substrate-binding protein
LRVTARQNRSRAIARLPLRLALALAIFAVGGCNPARVPKDELVVLIEMPPVNIDPRYAVNAYDHKIGKLVYAPLVSVDTQSLEPKMELAESVVPDGTDWVVTLREARFSDGRPVTADDVAYTIERLRDPKTSGAAARIRVRFEEVGLRDVEVVSPRKLAFHASRPHAPFITDLDFGILERPAAGSAEPAVAVGAGPFVLAERSGEEWRLKRNPYYFDGPARVETLVFKTIRDDNSRLLALVGGSADLTQNTISPLLLDAVAAQPKLKVETARSSMYTYLGVNCQDPILKDVRVRRAIAHAIDRAEIVHSKLRDRAVLATGMLPTFHWAYSDDVPHYDFDPKKAKQLLDEAGYPDPDGDGPLPRFTLVYRTSNKRDRVAIAQVIARMLGEVGIGVDLRINEFSTFFADVKKGNFQLFSMQIPEMSEPHVYSTFFESTRIPTRENLDAGNNRMRYVSPELDRLLDEGRRTLDRDGRKRVYAEIQRVLARDLPTISLWHEDNVAAMRKDVTGFEILPNPTFTSLKKTYKK